jgi:dihydroorotate dehydrogenase (fumarate)
LKTATHRDISGTQALVFNVHCVSNDISGTAGTVERHVLSIFQILRDRVDLPLNVKLSPCFSPLGNMNTALESKVAASVSLFNRFYQPNIDPETVTISDTLKLSTSDDSLLAMRWIAILHGRVNLSLAATGGIRFAEDALKMLLCGADVTHLGSTLLANGPTQLTRIHDNTVKWLQDRGHGSINDIRGSLSQINSDDPSAFARGHYMRMLSDYKL